MPAAHAAGAAAAMAVVVVVVAWFAPAEAPATGAVSDVAAWANPAGAASATVVPSAATATAETLSRLDIWENNASSDDPVTRVAPAGPCDVWGGRKIPDSGNGRKHSVREACSRYVLLTYQRREGVRIRLPVLFVLRRSLSALRRSPEASGEAHPPPHGLRNVRRRTACAMIGNCE
ncbi:hypothetical protein GCM10017674_69420 [Streptomyces gardneri]|nr:hypothetical protein GCM10017674_69420 [Streptomyces gardneri]